jgi:hypothetical protein
MGQKVSNFVKDVGVTVLKTAAKGATTALGSMVPYVGPAVASYINSRYAKGTADLQPELHPSIAAKLPEGFKQKPINTPAQLQDLVKKFPEQAAKAGLTVDLIKEEVQQAKEQVKAIGGLVSFVKPKNKIMPIRDTVVKEKKEAYAKGGKVRSAAQIEATRKLVEANRKRRAKK